MIKICDCITGGGKSTACINYMNDHPDQKFIYITPYTDEATRIVNACPALQFEEPSDKRQVSNFKKSKDTALLLEERQNIASTHQCFKFYTDEMLDAIRDGGYTLMIDENISVLEECTELTPDNVGMMEAYGLIEINDGEYRLTDKKYRGGWASQVLRLLHSRELIEVGGTEKEYYYWALPADLLTSFKDVIIMTYMFYGTDMYYFLLMNNIPFEEIGIRHDSSGYHFTDTPNGVTEQMRGLKQKIHICERESLNKIGEKYHNLSMNWLNNGGADVDQLRRHLSNWFTNINRDVPCEERLWATIGKSHGSLRSAGVWNNSLAFNARATNKYSDRTVLAYPANVFVNVNKKQYYLRHGIEFDENQYALSTMIQWIWRSAIRKGKEIRIYIPSRRMRNLFQQWLDGLENGKDWTALPKERGCVSYEEEVLQLPVG